MDFEKYMNRCLELAKNGVGQTYPNPVVGSVIVYKDKIIGEGWHHRAGESHAEVNAINSVKDKELLLESTIFVSLEPCSHFGKTPPCADLIVRSGIKKVIIGTTDPFDKVSGRGIEKLKNAGCEVVVGVLERECMEINKRFFCYHNQKRPYIILKWAQTMDGYIAPLEKIESKSFAISNELSHRLSHIYRSEEQAILIGANTAICDNPSLTTRLVKGNSPVRIVIDSKLRVNNSANVYSGEVKTIFFTNREVKESVENVIFCKINFDEDVVEQICEELYDNEIQSLIVEGGTYTINKFIECGKWDEARVFVSDSIMGDGVKAPKFPIGDIYKTRVKEDILFKIFRN